MKGFSAETGLSLVASHSFDAGRHADAHAANATRAAVTAAVRIVPPIGAIVCQNGAPDTRAASLWLRSEPRDQFCIRRWEFERGELGARHPTHPLTELRHGRSQQLAREEMQLDASFRIH